MSPISLDAPQYLIYVFIFVFFVAYILSFWLFTRKDLKANTIFDIAFLNIISAVISSRLLGMLLNLETYLERGVGLLPLNETSEGLRLLHQLPWSFFRFNDGNFSYIGIFLGLVIGMLIIYKNSNQKKTVFLLFDKLVLSYAFANLFLLIGLFIHGYAAGELTESILGIRYADGTVRYSIQLIQFSIITIFLVFSGLTWRVFANKQGMLSIIFFLIFSVSELYLRTITANYQPSFYEMLDYHQLIAVVVFFVGLILLIGNILENRTINKSFGGFTRSRSVPEAQFINQDRASRARERAKLNQNIETESSFGKTAGRDRFILSFGDKLRQEADGKDSN